MVFSKDGIRDSAEATLAVVAVGWLADTAGLSLATAGVETDTRGYVRVDSYFRTTAPHIRCGRYYGSPDVGSAGGTGWLYCSH